MVERAYKTLDGQGGFEYNILGVPRKSVWRTHKNDKKIQK